MSDRFRPLSPDQLAAWIFDELDANDSILGIPRELFFVPSSSDQFRTELCGHPLETPIGVAAGPHTQLAGNIVVAWLCGARVVELKTVQTLDELDVSKPCIDMQDVGYNIEWSQELALEQSLQEYQLAWILVHVLHNLLGFPGERPNVVFNISVGYDIEGIQKPNMQNFLRRMLQPDFRFDRLVEAVARHAPCDISSVTIPRRLSDNVTLSTMHGCPPNEICGIARHLMVDWGLHTSIKLNPTLLGAKAVRETLHHRLGYAEVVVPDEAFEHDLKFEDALSLIDELTTGAHRSGLHFGIKLANTLEVLNHRQFFTQDQQRMYLSGRPLHALVVQLAHRLTESSGGRVPISFAGGADAFNVVELLAAGLRPITSCSDLLRPPGYLRLLQYLDEISGVMEQRAAADLDGLILGTAIDRGWATDHLPSDENILSAAAANLARLAEDVLEDPNLQRDRFDRSITKTGRALQLFDCIKAPCTDACPIDQRVPQYMRAVREDRFDDAVAVTRHDNPLAAILGRACHHPCEAPCLRTHLDEPLAIREIKRFIVEHENSVAHDVQVQPGDVRVAIIGGGPCGLSAATFLARAGAAVTIFEARSTTGGMVSGTIPGYRAAHGAVERDLLRVSALGVEIHTGQRVGRDISLDRLRDEGFAYLVVATGAQQGLRLGIPGEDAQGVWDGLDFLRAARARRIDSIGGAVGVIGGGDAAMDCARTARRLGASDVSVLYRRTKDQMPAQREEIRGVQEEGIGIHELVVPTSAIAEDGRLTALKCRRARLGDVDASGRRMPVEIVGSDFEIQLDVLIVAIGQRPDLSLFGDDGVAVNSLGYLDVDPKTHETSIANVFAGGDIIGDGPATIVEAVGDGRRIASTILAREGISLESHPLVSPTVDRQDLLTRRARRRFRSPIPELPRDGRNGFDEVVQTLTREQAVVEASRCLDCDLLCSTCEWVCPNRAIFTYRITDLPPTVPLLIVRGAAVGVESTERLPIDQEYQVAVIADLCNECGNCTTFCPTSGRPYRDKPRLFTHRDDFLAESENAFLVNRRENEWTVQSKVGGALHELVFTDRLRYATEHLTVDLDPATFEMLQASVTKKTATTTVALRDCIAMWAILRGLINSMPWMPAATTPDQPMLDT